VTLALAAEAPRIADVRVEEGLPTLRVHGRPTPPLLFWTNWTQGLLAEKDGGLVLSQNPGQAWVATVVAGGPVVLEAEVTMEEGYMADATAFLEAKREHGGEWYILGLQYLRDRGPGDGCVPQTVASSIALAGKLYLAEDDTRTFLTPDDSGHGFGRCPDLATTTAVLARNWAAAVVQGGGLWWMDQGGAGYDDSDLVESLGRLARWHTERPRAAFRSAAEIAGLLDEPSTAFLPQNYELMLPLVIEQLVDELPFVGAPFGVPLTTDLPRARPYKLYIVPCAPAPSEETRVSLRGLYGHGATVLWLHAPGLMTAEGPSADAAGDLVGMQFALRQIGGPTHVRLTTTDGLAHGLPPAFTYGTDRRLGPLLEVVAPRAERLGEARCTSLEILDGTSWPWFCYQGTGLATKPVDRGRAVFSATGPVPAALVRNLARAAGVRMDDRKGNVTFVSAGLTAVHAAAAGRWTTISRR